MTILRVKALAAFQREQEQIAENNRRWEEERRQRRVAEFQRLMQDRLGLVVDEDVDQIEVEGLRFDLYDSFGSGHTLRARVELACGHPSWNSYAFGNQGMERNLAGLGALITDTRGIKQCDDCANSEKETA